MDRDGFWQLLEAARTVRGEDCQQQAAKLVELLGQRPVADIVAFDRIQQELMVESYRWDLWAVAQLINDGCLGDCFMSFRGWLLGQGRTLWEATLRDPDSLAAHPTMTFTTRQTRRPPLGCAEIFGVARDAYKAATGRQLTAQMAPTVPWPSHPSGENVNVQDPVEMAQRFPRLWARAVAARPGRLGGTGGRGQPRRRGPGMDRDGFWMLVEATNVDVDCEAHAERLSARLARLAPEEIIWFDRQFWQRLAEAYRWDLWGVAYQLSGGCSDDGFVYFRCWLLAQGQATWEAALHEPDSVADHPVVANRSGPVHEWAILECEPILYVTRNAYRTHVGAELPDDSRSPQPAAPLGEYWDFEDSEEAHRRLPRAWARRMRR
jgi:Protein of unknown function (DUF4240)